MEFVFDDIVTQLKDEYQTIKSISSSKQKQEKFVGNAGDDDNKNEKDLENDYSIIETKLDGLLSMITEDSPDYSKALSMITSILYEKAKVCLNTNLTLSKSYLEKALKIIQTYSDNPQIAFIYLRVVNYLSYVISRMGDFDRAKTLLEEVVNDELKCDPIVYSTEDLFASNQSEESLAKVKLQKLKINNMQMLGWIYGKLGMTNLYAETIHTSLQKELDINDGDAIHWATRCYRLASLFIVQDKWSNARYHLAAAQAVLDPLEVTLVPNVALFKAQADLARVWVSYGLQLFGLSKRSVLEKVWDEHEEIHRQDKPFNPKNFKFNGIEINLPTIPVKEITNIQEARDLFTYTHKWLKRARLFYTLRDYPLQYVNIILELSELYRYLAFYEKDVDSQYDVHKKRFETLEMLSSIMREVRPSCYASVSVEIIREVMDVQLEMMNLNLKKIFNPTEDTNFTESELKRRIDTVNHINAKIGKLCKKEKNADNRLNDEIDKLNKTPSTIVISEDNVGQQDIKVEENINESDESKESCGDTNKKEDKEKKPE